MASTNGAAPKKEGLTLSVIGCGTMATAILSGVLAACKRQTLANEPPTFTEFIATVHSDSSTKRLESKFGERITVLTGRRANLTAMSKGDVVLFGFKPYQIKLILSHSSVSDALTNKDKSIISVLVGSPVETLRNTIVRKDFGEGVGVDEKRASLYITRAMPNLAAEFGQSMTVIESHPFSEANKVFDACTAFIFSSLGRTQTVAPAQFDIAGVLAGASSAFLSVAFDGMLDGAVRCGMKRAEAAKILTGTLTSLAAMLGEDDGEGGKKVGSHPAILREGVSSPGGTTIEGLTVLEEERARFAFGKAVEKATERSKAMGA